MDKTIVILMLLVSYSINSSADESSAPIKDAKTQVPLQVAVEKPGSGTAIKKQPTDHDLIQQSLELARLEAELDRKQLLYDKRPKRKFISEATQIPEYRAHMFAFVKKIEEVGNAHYPKEFRRKNIKGRIVVTVEIRRDGTVENVIFNAFSIENPDVISELKAATLKFVGAATPFAALPETPEKIDFLHITRTWDFSSGDLETF